MYPDRLRRFPRSFSGARIASVAVGLLLAGVTPAVAEEETIGAQLARGLGDLAPSRTEVLYDRVLPLSGIERFHGGLSSGRADRATWRQLYHEIRGASNHPERWLSLEQVEERARSLARDGAIPVAIVSERYERLRSDALSRGALRLRDGRLERGAGEALEEARAFAAAALVERTYGGEEVSFRIDPSLSFGAPLREVELDPGDGLGFRAPDHDQVVRARYHDTGPKTIRLRARSMDAEEQSASFLFQVEALSTPTPHDTLAIAATIPFAGATATGRAYVYLAPGHTALVNPLVVVEGFDVDNRLGWNELYAQLNREDLLEGLRAVGWDMVLLDFTDASEHIQKNAFVLTELLRQVEGAIDPQAEVTLVGASMGGLVSRYALAWLETHGVPHRVRTLICFDTPNRGANIPLGIQYWVQFFADQSAEAASLLALLNRPAARQMLVYHYTDPPSGAAIADPLKGALAADFAAIGNYPSQPRLVAVSNGSGSSMGQGYNAGIQIVKWDYTTFWVRVLGNVWSVPYFETRKIFDGSLRAVIVGKALTVTMGGTLPYDDAPGGYKRTMAEMDAVQAPYGDIVALHPNHSFVSTVSALALDATNLYYNVAADPSRLTHTPFDAIYFPATNQEHLSITPENATWLRSEITNSPVAVKEAQISSVRLAKPWPSPSAGEPLQIAFELPRASEVHIGIFDVRGRLARRLLAGRVGAGPHRVSWDGRDEDGRGAGAGVFFVRLEAVEGVEKVARTEKLVLLK